MPKKPNYDFERKQRDHAKAAKKAEKLAIKVAARERNAMDAEPDEANTEAKTPSDD